VECQLDAKECCITKKLENDEELKVFSDKMFMVGWQPIFTNTIAYYQTRSCKRLHIASCCWKYCFRGQGGCCNYVGSISWSFSISLSIIIYQFDFLVPKVCLLLLLLLPKSRKSQNKKLGSLWLLKL